MAEEIEIDKFKELIKDMHRGFPRWLYGSQVEDVIPTENMRKTLEKEGFLVIEQYVSEEKKSFKYMLGPSALSIVSAWRSEELAQEMKNLTLVIAFLTVLLVVNSLFGLIAVFSLIGTWPLIKISTILHEKAHKKAAQKRGIEGTIKITLFGGEFTINKEEEVKLKKLSGREKKEIFYAGIKKDITISFSYLILSLVSFVSWINLGKVDLLQKIVEVIANSFMTAAVIIILVIVPYNLLHKEGDWKKLKKFLKRAKRERKI